MSLRVAARVTILVGLIAVVGAAAGFPAIVSGSRARSSCSRVNRPRAITMSNTGYASPVTRAR